MFPASSSSSSGPAFCSGSEAKRSVGEGRGGSLGLGADPVLVSSDGKSCHQVAVASVCVSSSHLIQPSASLLKRNSLCNLKDKTNVSAFSSVNAKGVSHTQVNGSIFLKSVLKLYFKHFYFTVIVVCVKINCPSTLERTSGCVEVSEASSYPVFVYFVVLFSKMTLECIVLVMQQCHFYFKTLSFLQPVCEGCRSSI